MERGEVPAQSGSRDPGLRAAKAARSWIRPHLPVYSTLSRTYPAFAYKEYFCGLNRPKRLIRRNLFSKIPPNFARFRELAARFAIPARPTCECTWSAGSDRR